MGFGDEFEAGDPGYEVEEQGSIYQQEVDDASMDIEDLYASWRSSVGEDADVEGLYQSAVEAWEDGVADPDMVYGFCERYGEDMLRPEDGLFVSAVINDMMHDSVRLPPMPEVDHLGYRNDGTDLLIEGETGDRTGERMQSGTVGVAGAVGDRAGMEMEGGHLVVGEEAGMSLGRWMRDGRITCEGGAGDDVGAEMRGGKIAVKDDVGDQAGYMMEGGSLDIYGDAGGRVGQDLNGGSISVAGDAGAHVGCVMEDGMVTIAGSVDHNLGRAMKGGELHVGHVDTTVGRLMDGGKIQIEYSGEQKRPERRGLLRRRRPEIADTISGGEVVFHDGKEYRHAYPPKNLFQKLCWTGKMVRGGLEDT